MALLRSLVSQSAVCYWKNPKTMACLSGVYTFIYSFQIFHHGMSILQNSRQQLIVFVRSHSLITVAISVAVEPSPVSPLSTSPVSNCDRDVHSHRKPLVRSAPRRSIGPGSLLLPAAQTPSTRGLAWLVSTPGWKTPLLSPLGHSHNHDT